MRIGKAAVAAVLLLTLAGCTGDRRRIERRTDELADLLGKDGPEDQLAAAVRARQVTELFGPGFLVLAESRGERISDRRELAGAVLRYRAAPTSIDVDFDVQTLEVREENRTASMDATARVTYVLGGDRGRERYRLRVGWAEQDGQWQIQEVEVHEAPEGLGGF